MNPQSIAEWWKQANDSDRKDFLRRIGAQERDAEMWVIYFANVRTNMNPQTVAEWFRNATMSERHEFLKLIGISWETYNLPNTYSPEAAAKEARTCIPDSTVKYE